MKNIKVKAFVIDFSILLLLGFLLMIGIYFLYNVFPSFSRLIAVLIILFMIPLFWGTIICSILGKKTIGNRMIEKTRGE